MFNVKQFYFFLGKIIGLAFPVNFGVVRLSGRPVFSFYLTYKNPINKIFFIWPNWAVVVPFSQFPLFFFLKKVFLFFNRVLRSGGDIRVKQGSFLRF